jgi:hypothetical protein
MEKLEYTKEVHGAGMGMLVSLGSPDAIDKINEIVSVLNQFKISEVISTEKGTSTKVRLLGVENK